MDLLRLMVLSVDPIEVDKPRWKLSQHGEFSSASYRSYMTRNITANMNFPWKKLWKFKGPMRSSLTMWMSLQRALPTAELLWRRSIIPSPVWNRCYQQTQTTIHALRNCPAVSMVWYQILNRGEWRAFEEPQEVKDWFYINLYRRSTFNTFGSLWPYVFRQLIHELWFNHNARNHNSHHFLEDPHALAKRSLSKVVELLLAWA